MYLYLNIHTVYELQANHAFRINSTISLDDWTSIITKYLNKISIYIISTLCKCLFMQKVIINLLPSSKLITVTNYITSCANYARLMLNLCTKPKLYIYWFIDIATKYSHHDLFLLINKKKMDKIYL